MQNKNTVTVQNFTTNLGSLIPLSSILLAGTLPNRSVHGHRRAFEKTSRSSPRNYCVFLPVDVVSSPFTNEFDSPSALLLPLFLYSTRMNDYTIFRLVLFFVLRSAPQVHSRNSLRFGCLNLKPRRNEPTQKKASLLSFEENATKQMQFSHSDHTRNRETLRANRSRALSAHFHDIFYRFRRFGNQFRGEFNLLRNFALSWLVAGWVTLHIKGSAARGYTQNIGNHKTSATESWGCAIWMIFFRAVGTTEHEWSSVHEW